MSTYISGPMRGIKHFNFPAFKECEKYLRAQMFTCIFNPARHDAEVLGMGWEPDETQTITDAQMYQWMRTDLTEVAASDNIVLLPGWETSVGACRELDVARWCGRGVFAYEPDRPAGNRLVGLSPEQEYEMRETASAAKKDPPHMTPGLGENWEDGPDNWGNIPVIKDPKAPVNMAYLLNTGYIDHNVAAPKQTYKPLRTAEQAEVLGTFNELLSGPTGDGGNKRARGEKPSWKIDTSHFGKALGHLDRYQKGEKFDKDSGCHPLVHVAWRLLAVAYQDMARTGVLPVEPT